MTLPVAWKRKEVAELFGVNIMTIYSWEKKEIITPSFYVGPYPRYTIEEIEKVATQKPTTFQKEKPVENE